MSVCPNCGAAVADDFGLTQCRNCQQYLIVDIDGGVQMSPTPGSPIAEPSMNEALASEQSEFSDEKTPAMPSAEFTAIAADSLPEEVIASPDVNAPSLAPAAVAPLGEFTGGTGTGVVELGADPSLMNYDLSIVGIDTSELRSAVVDVFSEPKLRLDSKLVAKSIRNGSVEVRGLSAAKVMVIVSQLRPYGVNVSWVQRVGEA